MITNQILYTTRTKKEFYWKKIRKYQKTVTVDQFENNTEKYEMANNIEEPKKEEIESIMNALKNSKSPVY